MPNLMVNQSFPAAIRRNSFVVITVVGPAGHVKDLRVSPGSEKLTWVRPEWAKDPKSGRVTRLLSVDLTSERVANKCLFLKQAYEAEGWAEGWAQYQAFLDSQYLEVVHNEEGQPVKRKRDRPVFMGHFPNDQLPLEVQQRRARSAEIQAGPRWEGKTLRHPNKAAAEWIEKQAEAARDEDEDEAAA